MSTLSPLSGCEPTYRGHRGNDVDDPKATCRLMAVSEAIIQIVEHGWCGSNLSALCKCWPNRLD